MTVQVALGNCAALPTPPQPFCSIAEPEATFNARATAAGWTCNQPVACVGGVPVVAPDHTSFHTSLVFSPTPATPIGAGATSTVSRTIVMTNNSCRPMNVRDTAYMALSVSSDNGVRLDVTRALNGGAAGLLNRLEEDCSNVAGLVSDSFTNGRYSDVVAPAATKTVEWTATATVIRFNNALGSFQGGIGGWFDAQTI
jgi:hypothetical protein